MDADPRLEEALKALRRGWALTPLDGKKPILKNWQRQPPPTEDHIRQWVAEGRNLGLRTGKVSDTIAVDDDTEDGSGARELGLPKTVTAVTGSGKRHYLYRDPGVPIGNSASKLHDHVDVRGEGGQIVFVGSIHPDTGQPYRWLEGHSPDEIELAELPQHIIDQLRVGETNGHARPAPSAAVPPQRGEAWAMAALIRELAEVAAARAGEGRAHAIMMSSGARLGQIVGAGLLDRESVIEQLVVAATNAGWEEREARRCANDAVEFGSKNPRGPAELPDIEIVDGADAGPQQDSEPLAGGAFEEWRKLIEFRDGVAWMPDLELAGESRRHPFNPGAKPFSAMRELAEQVARGLKSVKYEAKWLPLNISSIEIIARAKLSERAKLLVRVWYEVVRDQVPGTDHHLTYTVAADRLHAAHGEDLLWSAVSTKRIYQWDGIYWSHDQVALAQQGSDETAQTFLAEFEKLDRIADRLARDGDRSPELLANLEQRFPVEKWSTPPDELSRSAAERAKIAALARLQELDLGEDADHLCWRVNVASFLRGRAREVEAFYKKLETPVGIEAVLEKLRYIRQRPEEDFDREPYLLVAKDVVIDLRTGEPVAPDRAKLLTRQAGAKYLPGHRHVAWEAALNQWTDGDERLRRWLQVIVGYSLIGLRSGGRYIIAIFGPTRTGKGTFLKIVARALGMYASPFNARAFSDTRHSSHDEDLASLRGVRFAYASEMGSARFDAEKLKSASSGDPMRPSRKGEKSFEMRPECAIWMATNDLPRVPTHDPALWDRLRFVEFTRQFALSAYGDELAEDPDVLAAVLAWAVEGAVEFNKNGLPECDKVAKAIDKARGELDPLAEWFEERVDHKRLNAPEVFTAVASLYCDYVVQALASGERPVSKSEFGRLLAQRRVADARNDDVRGWRLKLRTPPRSRP